MRTSTLQYNAVEHKNMVIRKLILFGQYGCEMQYKFQIRLFQLQAKSEVIVRILCILANVIRKKN